MRPCIARLGALFVVTIALAACSANQGSVPPTASLAAPGTTDAMGNAANGPSRAVRVSQADVAAAYRATDFHYRIFPTSSQWHAQSVRPSVTKVFHPADLHYYGGPFMKTALEHDIYVNCAAGNDSCWGDPETFLTSVTNSQLVKVLTQYTKAKPGAYVFSEGTQVTWPAYSHYYYDNDLFSILHAVAKQTGGTYKTDEFHIFLPKGTDTCFTGTSICYSPDVPSTFVFCAYHGLVKFSDLGMVTFSVEPYQNVTSSVGGCVYPNLPKGYDPLINSTDTTLAHEMFESISDTDPNAYKTLAWYNLPYNSEMADLCDAFPIVQKFGGKNLFIQTMYSNKYHGCANGP